MDRLKNLVFHPYLFAAYSILALLAYNIEVMQVRDAFRSLVFSFLLTTVLLLLSRWLLKDWLKAGLVASLTLLLFFAYGHVYSLAETTNTGSLPLGRHRLMVPVFLIVWAVGVLLIARYKGDLRPITRLVTLVAGVALIFPIFQLGKFSIDTYNTAASGLDSGEVSQAQVRSTPDIYYIILDAYGRDDVLADFYEYDNTAFIQQLEDLGFFVARCSQSNYSQTQLSVASSMSMDMVQQLDPFYTDPTNLSKAGLPYFIRDGAVRQVLESMGYTIVAFDSGYSWTMIPDADFFLQPFRASTFHMGLLSGFNEFEAMLIDTSAGVLVTDATLKLPEVLAPEIGLKKMHRERILYTLDQLPKIPPQPGPKFIFAHIGSPHTPYVFGPDGEMVGRDIVGIEGYQDQVTYLNKRMIPILQQIIADSAQPPIIIIQADHGGINFNPDDRMRILNAYYLPDGGEQVLYQGISPVNTYRLLFNYYFGTHYPQLEDISYYSDYDIPYDFTVMPETRPGCENPSSQVFPTH